MLVSVMAKGAMGSTSLPELDFYLYLEMCLVRQAGCQRIGICTAKACLSKLRRHGEYEYQMSSKSLYPFNRAVCSVRNGTCNPAD